MISGQWNRLLHQLCHRTLSKKTQSILKNGSRSLSDVYNHHYDKSLQTPEEFWHGIAQDVTWFKNYEKVLDHSNPPFTKWYGKYFYIFYVNISLTC